jgi:NADH:ubiquinone oxidoreductase subunit
MTTLGTKLYTLFKGHCVGKDSAGNQYYEAWHEKTADGHKKRWVIYQGLPEPSKVVPQWHGWLHYTSDLLPIRKAPVHYPWMREPQPNLTGTKLAYVPKGHINRGGERAAATSDYEAWKP